MHVGESLLGTFVISRSGIMQHMQKANNLVIWSYVHTYYCCVGVLWCLEEEHACMHANSKAYHRSQNVFNRQGHWSP
jgi:hypothetical protein